MLFPAFFCWWFLNSQHFWLGLLYIAEHSTLWCIAVLYRDEEHNSEEATEEEGAKDKDNLEQIDELMYSQKNSF